AVEDPAPLRAHRAGRHRGEVAPGARLAEQLAPDLASREDRGEPPLLLLGGAVGEQGGADEVDPDPSDQLRRAGPGELLDDDEVLDRPRATAAVLLGPRHADPPALGELRLPLPSEGDL